MAVLVPESVRKAPARLASTAILATQSDDRLVQLVRDGHERAFDAIVDRYRASLVRYCRRILPESRTEDAVQQAFINAHSALRTSDAAVQLKPWLFAITRNAALNMLRQNGWNYEQIPADFDGVMRPDQAVEQKIQLQTTVAAVNELPDRQRRAIVMRELEGRSYEEISVALAAGDGAVRQLLNRARGTLRSVATALMPPPLVARAAESMPPSDGRRIAEVLGSLGAAGAVKVGATAVVAGSLVVGAVKAPLPIGDHHATAKKAAVSASRRSSDPAPGLTVANGRASAHVTPAGAIFADRHGRGSDHFGGGKHESGSRHSGSTPRSDDHRGGSGSGSSDRSGSDDRSGSNAPTRSDDRSSNSGSGSGSDSGDSTSGRSGGSDDSTSGSSGSDGSTSSGSGSDDVTTLVQSDTSDTSGSGSGGSGTDDSSTSGSGTSGPGTSGSSGTSGSGSDDVLTSSGSGSSGSGKTSTTEDH